MVVPQNVHGNSFTIFSPAWAKVYGIPYTAGYGSNRDISSDYFKCTEDSINVKVFSGRIE
jgi:hypothetical protein